MKRASLDSHQFQIADEQSRARLKYQNLVQEYLQLQKEYVSKKRKLQIAQEDKEILSAEVRFLKRRYKYLTNLHSPPPEPEQVEVKLHNPYAPSRKLEEERSIKKAVSKEKPPRPEKKNVGKKKLSWQDRVVSKV